MTRFTVGCAALIAAAGAVQRAGAQAIEPLYQGSYSLVDLGSPPGVPAAFGGLCFLPGDPNTLLIGGQANAPTAAIYRIGVVRDGNNNITGFSGTAAVVHASAPNIDGGLTVGPLSILMYTGYPINTLGQIKVGSTAPDKIIDLTALGVASSVGTCAYVPSFAPGAGKLKIASYNTGFWYSATLVSDGTGTLNLVDLTPGPALPGGPEGIVYVPTTSPLFSNPTILISDYATGRVVAYDANAAGDPIVATGRPFITGLSGAEGAALDPLTSQFMFSTFSGSPKVYVVRGFALPPPCYANCDDSTTTPVLNAQDFACFLNRFAKGNSYANCDGSTTIPSLNVQDFSCFLNRFAQGCP